MPISLGQYAAIILGAVIYSSPDKQPELPINEYICMAHAIYHESAAEPFESKLAVANVIKNRMKSDRWGNTACEVVLDPAQFSYLRDARRRKLVIRNSIDYQAFYESAVIAFHILEGRLYDPTNGANHYYNPSLAAPKWASKGTNVQIIGNHKFMHIEW